MLRKIADVFLALFAIFHKDPKEALRRDIADDLGSGVRERPPSSEEHESLSGDARDGD